MHNLFRGVILLSKLLCAPHILEYTAALNIIFLKIPPSLDLSRNCDICIYSS
ncbi:hypothetical protein [Candidatus Sarmatiella mevalonica]|uniref:hypothetical protein n=1 Tax=Candidatus Sarmatiella mevalonica TaxID=2770581 RepID=UPI001921DE65|nr:hypothetical protein [Candidatus Sarmatiella mevalonica]